MKTMFGKRQVLIATLVVALGLAIYLNFQFNKAGEDFTATGALSSSSSESHNYGDAAYVNASEASSGDVSAPEGDASAAEGSDASAAPTQGSAYFVEARLNREQSREEAVDFLKDVLADAQADDSAKTEALAASAKIAQNVKDEGEIENLIKAKGFTECMVYIEDDKANVIVQSDGLLPSEVAQIKDVITSNAQVSADNITIVPVQ